MKRLLACIIGFLLLFSACNAEEKGDVELTVPEYSPEITLQYYTIGWADEDLELVNEELNRYLKENTGFSMEYKKLGWADYDNKLNTLISSGSQVDIVFAYEYVNMARKGAWLPLTEYLEGDYRLLYDTVDPLLWQGARLSDGEIYGVPTNKETSVQENWMYPLELVEKYDIDIEHYTTLESLAPLFEQIANKEPEYLVMELDTSSHDFFAIYGYEELLHFKLPLSVNIYNEPLEVVNLFETPEAESILNTLREYYLKGYINQDAALRQNQDLEHGAKTFWKQASGSIYSDNVWSKDRGYEVISRPVTPLVVVNKGTRDAVMSLTRDTRYPEEGMTFLTLLNTDPELRNLMNYGVEGVHYTLTDEQQVRRLNERYRGVQYTQGNWFILHTLEGDSPNQWELLEKRNKEAKQSPLLGFTPDVTRFEREIQLIQNVRDKYYPSLMTGSVPVEEEWPKFVTELKEAGIDSIKEELQHQLDDWLKRQ